jgi:hypothetical protein
MPIILAMSVSKNAEMIPMILICHQTLPFQGFLAECPFKSR